MTNEEAKRYLLLLRDRLIEIKNVKDDTVNIFYAVGMRTQEIKHSAFLAWLLNPRQPHGLNSEFLKRFIDRLIRTHAINLSNSRIRNIYDVQDFLSAEDLTVETEKTIDGNDSRIDIFIQSQTAKTVIVIENKTFTTTHDNQLTRYEEKLSDLNHTEWKKIFVYLTPDGDTPTEEGQEKLNWCKFSYFEILKILEEILKHKASSIDVKVKLLMEDYITMVNTDILKGNKELRDLCKQIRREHKEALDILMSYTDNADEVMSFCANWCREEFSELKVTKELKRSFEFYTPAMTNYFINKGEDIFNSDGDPKLRIGFGYSDTIAVGMSLQKGQDEEWSNAQKLIINKYVPEKIVSDKYISLSGLSVVLVSAKDREIEFENIKETVGKKLSNMAETIRVFETVLTNL